MSTSYPITDMTGHLAWTHHGTVWATWRLQPLPYGRRPLEDKVKVKDLHKLLLRGLTGEALLLGMSVSLDPSVIVERQLEGVDLEQCPDWALEAEANLDRLSELALGERVYYLAVPLANQGSMRWHSTLDASLGKVRDQLQLPRTHPSASVVAQRLEQADRIQQVIPAPFNPTPATVAEQVWIAAHAQRRGMVDFAPPMAHDEVGQELLAPRSGVAIPEPILDEGAKSDLEDTKGRVNPLSRRVLKVTDPRAYDLGQGASYQCLMVLADTPPAGLVFPGSEILAPLDHWGMDVDWAIRLRANAREKAMQKNRRATRELNDQYSQRESIADSNAAFTTGQPELDLAGELLSEYQGTLSNDRLEVEVEHTVILAVGGDDAHHAQERADFIARELGQDAELSLERPVGAQEDLWWAMQPGIPASRVVRAYAQFATSDGLGMTVPLTNSAIGGSKGQTFALNLSGGRADVVHLDPSGYPRLNKSGSVCFYGELGAGKSFGMKTLSSAVVDLGGQLLIIDRSAEGEWAVFARALTASVIVHHKDPQWSMDPLRVIEDVEEATSAAQSFLTQLLDVSPQESAGKTLGAVLTGDYLAHHQLHSLREVMEHLAQGHCPMPEAIELGTHMRNYAVLGMGRLVFDDTLPPVDARSTVVWRTHGMEQPSADELANHHLYRSLRREKIFGRAYYHLLIATAKRWAFADRTRTTALICDEAHDITSNPENNKYLELFIREGRRADALLILGSHNPEADFGTETMRGLIPTRIALRQTDRALAKASVRTLGLDEDDPDFEAIVEALMTDTSPVRPDLGVDPERRGECFIRDAFGGIAFCKILGPARQDRAASLDTTPERRQHLAFPAGHSEG